MRNHPDAVSRNGQATQHHALREFVEHDTIGNAGTVTPQRMVDLVLGNKLSELVP